MRITLKIALAYIFIVVGKIYSVEFDKKQLDWYKNHPIQ